MIQDAVRALVLVCTLSCSLGAAEPPTSNPANAPGQTEESADQKQDKNHVYPKIGSLERLDPALDQLLSPTVQIEKLASGFRWAEGPVWDRRGDALYFSDVPNNVVFKWRQGVGTREFLLPSGYTGTDPKLKEAGSNGLTFDRTGHLVLCQHGNRQVVRLESNGKFTAVARYYNFQRFNSPNDLVYKSNGDLYFTDPPYGLPKGAEDSAKELNFSGVYRVTPKGEVTLLTTGLNWPNGLAFSPDENTLYIAVSDPKAPRIMAYHVLGDGTLASGRVFFDAAPLAPSGKGLPDGLKVDHLGNVWSSGPGGILVIAPNGHHLGTVKTGEVTSNCAFGGRDGSILYMTADSVLCRVQTLTKGATF
jgi:gluconolactonase